MIKLFTDQEFEHARRDTLLPLQCEFCQQNFYKTKKRLQDVANPNKPDKADYCSRKCIYAAWAARTSKEYTCKTCQTMFIRTISQIGSENVFCCKSCAAIYNSTHKTKGTRRSKLEIWLENKLNELYPNLEIYYNRKDAINSELDIYIPSLKLAFELNGIFHYEPIYGEEKLNKIQNNDERKFQACFERGIGLCILDTSKQAYFKEKTSLPYLEIICNIINGKLAVPN